jgi:hypothetical protein
MAVVTDGRDIFASAEISMTGVELAMSSKRQMESCEHTNLQRHGKS